MLAGEEEEGKKVGRSNDRIRQIHRHVQRESVCVCVKKKKDRSTNRLPVCLLTLLGLTCSIQMVRNSFSRLLSVTILP